MLKRVVLAASLVFALAACQDEGNLARSNRHIQPIPPATMSLMAQKGMAKSDPILIRAYKKESELELWKKGRDGRYALLKTYPICRWSGQLGPKVREGDRQAPEGFYMVNPAHMNPNSSFYLSFDTGYPNAFDKAHGRTGSHLMVHGSCSSRGCFAMTDEAIAEVYSVAREAFAGGQRAFQFQSLPFRMTAQNLAKHRYDPNMPFWKNLKEGSDHFEVTKLEPAVSVCQRRYVFNRTTNQLEASAPCRGDVEPSIAGAVAQKQADDERQVASLIASGAPAVKLVYEDGGGHASFREVAFAAGDETGGSFAVLDARQNRRLGDVSRPDALALGPREIPMEGPGRVKSEALAFAAAQPVRPRAAPETRTVAVAEAAPVQAPAAPAPAPAAAAPAQPTVVASASPALTPSRPLYERVFGGLFSSSTSEAKETAPAQPVASPLPPPRPAVVAPRPQAATPAAAPDRRAEAPAKPGLFAFLRSN
jgi:murein L,D-transpeptidase YafK